MRQVCFNIEEDTYWAARERALRDRHDSLTHWFRMVIDDALADDDNGDVPPLVVAG